MASIINETLSPDEINAIMEGTKAAVKAETAPPPIWPELERLAPARLAAILENEHPQTIAMILANIVPAAAAAAILQLPKPVRGEAVKRMIALGVVPDRAKSIVENQLRVRLDAEAHVKDISAGQMRVANVLNQLDKAQLEEVMEDVEAAGAPNLEALRAKLFSFEDVVLLSQKSRVALFDSMPTELITVALRDASPELAEAVLSAIGARSRRMIESELQDVAVSPPADEIARARKTIASNAIRLAGEGLVELPNAEQQEAA
jgi:flagellar motor switch protein FliG